MLHVIKSFYLLGAFNPFFRVFFYCRKLKSADFSIPAPILNDPKFLQEMGTAIFAVRPLFIRRLEKIRPDLIAHLLDGLSFYGLKFFLNCLQFFAIF